MNALVRRLYHAYEFVFTGGVVLPSAFLLLLRLYFFWQLFLTGKISQKTDRKTCGRDTEEVIGELNLMLKGWANYFQLGVV